MKFGSSQTGVGKSVERVEDARLLTGRGRYTDDFSAPGMAYGVTLRSPYGHARIASIDASAARAMPGVLAVYLHEDIAHYGEVPCLVPLSGPIKTPRHLLTGGQVRFVGDGIAFVVAETREQARAAADAIEIDFDELPAVASIEAAIAPGAHPVWPDAPANELFLWEVGDRAVQARHQRAQHLAVGGVGRPWRRHPVGPASGGR